MKDTKWYYFIYLRTLRLRINIIAIYFMALSLVPCTDGAESHTVANASAEISQGQSDQNPSNHEDHCTPFCTCACCGTVVTLPFINQIDMSSVDLSCTYQFHYSLDYSFDYSEGVWHPPAFS